MLHSGSAAQTRAGLAIVATIGIATLAGTAAGSGMQDAPALPIVLAPVAFILLAAFWLAPRLRGETGGNHARIGDFRHAADPIFITDLDGQPLAANPAAGTPLAGNPAGAPLSADQAGDFLAPYVADAPACRYRLLRDVMRNGIGSYRPRVRGERHLVSVTRLGRDRLLWQMQEDTDLMREAQPLPWLRIDTEDRVIDTSPALLSLLQRRPGQLCDIFGDLPLRPGGVHLLAGSGTAVRVLPLDARGEERELLILPLKGDELSGLVPNGFLDGLPVALARLEPDGRLIFANKPALALLGERATPGTNLCDLIEGLGRPISERLDDTLKGRALGRSEVARSRTADPEIFLQVAFTRTIIDGAPSILAVLSDATELKTLEAQFVQSQKMQAVGQLAGGIAHDFNNLLTAINGHCDLLLMRHDVADIEYGDLMQIRQNANRAAALVRQLLAFSRKQTLRPTVIDLRDTLGELAHLLNRLLTDKVTLHIEHRAELWPVRVDERQLEQVIMNLVVNARDAMPAGGEVHITTRNERLADDLHRDRAVILPGDYVVIDVADSGTGIPKDKLHKIFEPFYTTKPVGEGTGLGLSTAYGIIKQTGGFIFASSTPGQGATFTIYLPAHERSETMAPPPPAGRRARDLTGRGHILLVEDEEPVRAFAARALTLRGYTVVEASSGEEAIALLEDPQLRVDIMVSDVIMPGLDGPGWVRKARKLRPDAKVIFMSGYAEDAFTGGDAPDLSDASFLSKPFTLNELTEKVKSVLED